MQGLPALACKALLPRAADSTASPGTGAGDNLPPGGCQGNLGKIAFSYDPHETATVNYGIYVMNSDGSNRMRLSAPDEQTDTHPAWSPDRCQIAFTRFTGTEEDDIYVMSADGKSVRRLTTDPARDMFPDWSPDGNQIVFVSYRDSGTSNLFVMNAHGSHQRQLTHHKIGIAEWEQWSPNGDEIAHTYHPARPS